MGVINLPHQANVMTTVIPLMVLIPLVHVYHTFLSLAVNSKVRVRPIQWYCTYAWEAI
jgi:hypothetical protein